jgi:hypothetical protein
VLADVPPRFRIKPNVSMGICGSYRKNGLLQPGKEALPKGIDEAG